MKTIKVSIQDQNTLILLEDAQRGDLIDLKSIHELDIDKSTLDNIIKSIKTEEFNSQLEAAKLGIEKEKNFDYKIREREMLDKAKDDLNKKDQVITSLNTKLETIAKQTESEAKVKTLEETQRIEAEDRVSQRVIAERGFRARRGHGSGCRGDLGGRRRPQGP